MARTIDRAPGGFDIPHPDETVDEILEARDRSRFEDDGDGDGDGFAGEDFAGLGDEFADFGDFASGGFDADDDGGDEESGGTSETSFGLGDITDFGDIDDGPDPISFDDDGPGSAPSEAPPAAAPETAAPETSSAPKTFSAPETGAPETFDAASHGPTGPSPSEVASHRDELILGKGGGDALPGGDGVDDIRGFKGEDTLDGNGGDDWLRGGHGADTLDGGAGSDVLDGGKDADVLIYTLSENLGASDYYDGGKGSDILQINLTADEYRALQEELIDIRDWIAENSDPKSSSSHGFNDASANGPHHPIYETSFGLTIRNFEDLRIEVEGYGEVSLDEGLPEADPAPEPEPTPDEPIIVERPPAPEDEAPSTVMVDFTSPPEDGVSVALRPGSTATVSIQVDVSALPPQYDVFLVQDLSGSFYNDLPNVQAQFSSLYDSLSATSDVQFGIGSFVDKPVFPFGDPGGTFSWDIDGTTYSYSYPGDFVYNTDLTISGDKGVIQAALDGLSIYSGADWAEAQLEALVQVALRDAEIGFRDGSQKFVVLSTDAHFHKEGDYAEAGPNDYDTVIEDEDYPSIAAVGELLEAAGITPIFAITEDYRSYYDDLVDIWGFGSVTTLASDSSNLVSAITEGLLSASLDLAITVEGDEFGYVSSITPTVYEDAEPGTYIFDVTLEIPEGSIDYSSDAMTFEIAGYGEVSLEVDIARVDATGDAGDDTLIGEDGPNGLYGMGGDDILVGAGGDDLLAGGADADTLTGGLGDDIFVFTTGDGTDTVTDFAAGASGGDLIDLRRLGAVASYAEVLAAGTDVSGDTVFDFGGGDSLTVVGVDLSAFHEADFLV